MMGTNTLHALRRAATLVCVGLTLAATTAVPEAEAQRPFRVHDPFYRTETARRTFFDGYALSTQVSYRSGGTLQGEGAADPDPLGVSFRADYSLTKTVDLSAIFDASGSTAGRRVTLSWIALKYYRNVDGSDDYAMRLAVDPASDGRVGFPQIDAAFIYTSVLSPIVSSDFAIGVRRVRMGFEQLVPAEGEEQPARHEVLYTRANGWELHTMISYNALLDPTGSNLFVAFAAELSLYQLIDLSMDEAVRSIHQVALSTSALQSPQVISQVLSARDYDDFSQEQDARDYHSAVLWVRSGFTFNRPSYQLLPFVSVPLGQWLPGAARWHRARLHLGMRFMLR